MHKKLLLSVFLIMGFGTLAFGQISWKSPAEQADQPTLSDKKTLLFITAKDCPTCTAMEREVFSDPRVVERLAKNFITYRYRTHEAVPASFFGKTFKSGSGVPLSKNPFLKYYSVTAIPGILILDETGTPLTAISGGITAKELLPYLDAFGTDRYKSFSTKADWEQYRAKYKAEKLK